MWLKHELERMHEELASVGKFAIRLVRYVGIILVIIAVSLLIGTAGYHYFGELPWLDALHNATMILTGMGPLDQMRSTAAKVFVIAYALYSAVAFVAMVTFLMTPIVHRMLHKFYIPKHETKQHVPSEKDAVDSSATENRT